MWTEPVDEDLHAEPVDDDLRVEPVDEDLRAEMMRAPRPGDRVELIDGTVAMVVGFSGDRLLMRRRQQTGRAQRWTREEWGIWVLGAVALKRAAPHEGGPVEIVEHGDCPGGGRVVSEVV